MNRRSWTIGRNDASRSSGGVPGFIGPLRSTTMMPSAHSRVTRNEKQARFAGHHRSRRASGGPGRVLGVRVSRPATVSSAFIRRTSPSGGTSLPETLQMRMRRPPPWGPDARLNPVRAVHCPEDADSANTADQRGLERMRCVIGRRHPVQIPEIERCWSKSLGLESFQRDETAVGSWGTVLILHERRMIGAREAPYELDGATCLAELRSFEGIGSGRPAEARSFEKRRTSGGAPSRRICVRESASLVRSLRTNSCWARECPAMTKASALHQAHWRPGEGRVGCQAFARSDRRLLHQRSAVVTTAEPAGTSPGARMPHRRSAASPGRPPRRTLR